MSEHPYKPQPWRLTEYYPEAYARFMDILNDGIIPDWNDDDHDRHEAEFLADLAAHDAELVDALVDAIRAELRAQIAADVAHAIDTHVMTWDETTAPHVRKGWRIARSIALDTITNPKEPR